MSENRAIEPQDIVQEAWIDSVYYVRSREVRKDFKSLLQRIVHNKCVDLFRKQKS